MTAGPARGAAATSSRSRCAGCAPRSTGDVLRLAVAIEQVRATLRLGRPFRWTVSVWSQAIGGELGDVWIDDPPADQQFAPGAGVLHRP